MSQAAQQQPDPKAWLAVAGAIFGTFMALLDVSVTNASLPQIQGEIGATGTEGTWIGTGYLVAEIVMIPLTAWFSRLMGERNFLIVSSVLFTLFSMLCGFSGNLTAMIAIVLVFLLYIGIERADPDWSELGRADWLGIAGLAMFLGSLTVILEEGQREYWYDSPLITWLTVVSALGFMLVMYAQFTNPHPVVKLRLLLKSSYRAVFGIVMLIGAGSFTMLYVVPVFLGTVAGYNAQQTGGIAAYTGISTFVMMPVLMVMMQKVDLRLIVGSGMVIFGVSCLLNLDLTAQSVGYAFILPQLINGIGQPMIGLTLSQAATAGLAEDEIPDGTALFSMARNLGGSMGLALTGILIDRRLAFHTAQLGQADTANSAAGQERIGQLTASMLHDGTDPAFAAARALKMIGAEVQRQALVMSYIDGFWVMGIGILVAIPAVLFLRRGTTSGAVGAH